VRIETVDAGLTCDEAIVSVNPIIIERISGSGGGEDNETENNQTFHQDSSSERCARMLANNRKP
ncbi:MAG: hypothetical protein ACRD8U_02820, partial [Pyrinomonadaceae bacterium]